MKIPTMVSAGFFGIFAIVMLCWLWGCDWYFDSIPEGLLLRQEDGFYAMAEDAGASLYTPAILASIFWERLLPSPAMINRVPLFLFSILQLLPFGCFCLERLRHSTRYRRLFIWYVLGCLVLSLAGFVYLHWTIRPKLTHEYVLRDGANKSLHPIHDQFLSWLGMCVACESLSVSTSSGDSGHGWEDVNVRIENEPAITLEKPALV